VGAPSFLTVLKRFGHSNPAPLSFPIPGWTLAADVPAAIPGLLEALDQLDEEVVAAGGRLYLAKDSRQSAGLISKTYPELGHWKATKRILTPARNVKSSMSIRLLL
jgi:decaprenylphospho-beta-D-ribofuranose 2-oxidase